MNLWKPIKVMIFIGLTIITVFVNGQSPQTAVQEFVGKEVNYEDMNADNKRLISIGLSVAIEKKVGMVKKVSNLQIWYYEDDPRSLLLTFTVETGEGVISNKFSCNLHFNAEYDMFLKGCKSDDAIFKKQNILILKEDLQHYIQNNPYHNMKVLE